MKRYCCNCKKLLMLNYLLNTKIIVGEIFIKVKCPNCETVQMMYDLCDNKGGMKEGEEFKDKLKRELDKYVG